MAMHEGFGAKGTYQGKHLRYPNPTEQISEFFLFWSFQFVHLGAIFFGPSYAKLGSQLMRGFNLRQRYLDKIFTK